MNKADESAYPVYDAGQQMEAGLTKREYFAAMAMQGMVANPTANGRPEDYAADAVAQADALIEALDRAKEGK